MPELPEVETIARGLEKRVRGRRIESVWLGAKPEPFRSSPPQIEAMLTGSRIEAVGRVGKHIVVDLLRCDNRKGQWLVHLGMTGRLLVVEPDVTMPAHTHAVVQLDDGRELRFIDPRRFGRLSIIDNDETVDSAKAGNGPARGFTGTGQEPLEISVDAFIKLFRARRTPIKSALLNQKLLHGVGNIYADESLFRAGIRPKRQAARVSRQELTRLHAGLQTVLREAIALGGSSVSDYVDADGARGFFQLEHRVYLRAGKPCLACGTPVRRIVLGGRGTHYCPVCQR